ADTTSPRARNRESHSERDRLQSIQYSTCKAQSLDRMAKASPAIAREPESVCRSPTRPVLDTRNAPFVPSPLFPLAAFLSTRAQYGSRSVRRSPEIGNSQALARSPPSRPDCRALLPRRTAIQHRFLVAAIAPPQRLEQQSSPLHRTIRVRKFVPHLPT